MRQQIKISLNHAVNQLPHPSFEKIASAPVQKLRVHDAITAQEEKPRVFFAKRTPVRRLATAFACCALFFVVAFGLFFQNFAVDSRITIDVNPSFEITTSRRERVLQVKALNADAAEVLEGRSFHGWAVDAAVETLFASLGESRYMDAEKNTVLLCVHSQNAAHTKELEQELTLHIKKALAGTAIKPHIVCQELGNDTKLQKEAQQYQVSSGKLQAAYRLQSRLPNYSLQELTAFPLNRLLALLDIFDLDDDMDDDWDDEIDDKNDHDDKDDKDDKNDNEDIDDKNDNDDSHEEREPEKASSSEQEDESDEHSDASSQTERAEKSSSESAEPPESSSSEAVESESSSDAVESESSSDAVEPPESSSSEQEEPSSSEAESTEPESSQEEASGDASEPAGEASQP